MEANQLNLNTQITKILNDPKGASSEQNSIYLTQPVFF